MRALRIAAAGAAEIADVPPPAAEPRRVLVTVVAAAICSTDRKMIARGEPLGRTLGHEGAGLLADGTPVGIHPDAGCGHCRWCLVGWSNRCAERVALGIAIDGCLAETVSISERHVVPLDGVPLSVAPLLEPLACAVHAVSVARLDPSARVAVIGAGAMGVFTAWAAQAAGAEVVVAQRGAERAAQARDLGLEVVAPDALETSGVDAVFVTAPGSEPLDLALRSVEVGGTVHAFAGTPGGALVDANLVHYRQLTLVGSTGSGLVDYRRALELQRTGVLDVARLPVVRIPLTDAAVAASDPRRGIPLRTVVDVREEHP